MTMMLTDKALANTESIIRHRILITVISPFVTRETDLLFLHTVSFVLADERACPASTDDGPGRSTSLPSAGSYETAVEI